MIVLLTRADAPCIYDGKKNKPGVKPGAIENLNRRIGMQLPPSIPPLLFRSSFPGTLCTPR